MIVTITLNPSLDREGEIDNFRYSDALRLHNVMELSGGKGVNVSRIVRRLGQDTVCLGFVGGLMGGRFLNLLGEEDIPQDFTIISGELRSNLAVVDKSVGKVIKLNEPGPHVSPEDVQKFLLNMEEYIEPDNYFILSGSLPEGLDADVYSRIIDLLDGKVRGIIMDTESAVMQKALEDRKVDFIKPNRFETERLVGKMPITDGNFRKALWKLRDYAKMPLISTGEEGIYFEDKDEKLYQIVPPKVVVISPVGAGDSFLAGFIANLMNGATVLDAVKFGVACGSATTRAGRPCEKEEAEELLPQVKVRECV